MFVIHGKCMYSGCYCVNNIRNTKMSLTDCAGPDMKDVAVRGSMCQKDVKMSTLFVCKSTNKSTIIINI